MEVSPRLWSFEVTIHGVLVSLAVISPFPFYYLLWHYPQRWVQWCGPRIDPSHLMSNFSFLFKLLQILGLLSVAKFAWPSWLNIVFIVFGQYLNLRVYQLLGEDGVYYGVRFGKQIPWVDKFPFGYMRDPQYIGSILTLLGCFCWFPWYYIALWISGYLFMMILERKENVSSRAKSH
ncbi:hypothetical protein O6H91_06G049500 [Diphasiastrum complanatum]|uniref:Uncharacterized protein n=1 Tax=Diphasiastrum complanatum TaxID=34168 RepID=A0ACC2DDI2_DIPCM|nr:hypothetical protein O6H91_06G049500 [Diphasiastrum complanatum]